MTKAGTLFLFNTDLETVFTNYSVEEIEKLSQGLKHDIDQKREELRTMVGERYRDLMEAADTITQMKASSEAVISNMKSIVRSSNELQSMSFNRKSETRGSKSRNREIGDEDEDDVNGGDDVIDDRMVAIAAQIKLLTDSPEKMWSAVEHNDFLTATQLYLFARHVHTSLSTCDVDGSLAATFPVIERQWAAVAHFNDAIYEACQRAIASPDTDPDKAVEAMASMFFLRGITSPSLMSKLLSSREASLKEFLLRHESRSAKAFIGQTLMSIVSCLSTVHKAFIVQQDGTGFLECIIRDVSCKPTLSLFHGLSSFSSPVMKYLPNIVREFCPSIVSVTSATSASIKTTPTRQNVDIELVKNECTQWLDRIHDYVSERTASILEHVTTISGLSMIRKAIYQRLKDELVSVEWEALCLATLQRKMNLWDEFYRNLFLDRVEALIEVRMTEMSQLVLAELGKPDFNDADTFGFIWSEVGLNNDSSLNKAVQLTTDNNQLSMKTKAFSPHIQNVCSKLNLCLQKLLDELYDYVDSGEKASANAVTPDPLAFLNDRDINGADANEPFSLTIDNETILKFSQKTCFESVEKMVSEIGQCKKNENSSNFIEVGRFFSAIAELCPALQKCVEVPSTASENDMMSIRSIPALKCSPEWNNIKKILEEESNRYFVLWIGELVTDLKSDLSNFLTDNFGSSYLANWESSEISEEAEDGTQLRSVIRVPQNISIGLHSALSAFVNRAHSVGPHALPQQVQLALTQDCATAIVCAYFEYSEQRKLMQDVALQLHFDVQFLLQCVVSRDNRTLSTSAASTLASLEKHIDPFDLSVFSSLMSENVKRCAVRNQTTYGILIPSDRFSLLSSMKFSNERSGSSEHQHNVIRMSSINFRFPLLPVTSISGKPQQRGRGRQTRDAMPISSNVSASRAAALAVQQPPASASRSSSSSSTSASTRRRSKSPAAKNTTASFFGSMSSSWFGSGK